MGVEPYLVSSALLAVLSQRLVRRICPSCRSEYFPTRAVLTELGMDEGRQMRLWRGKGCPVCYDSGDKGRSAIYELLEQDEGLQSLTLGNPTIDALRRYAMDKGLRTLKADGYAKVLSGMTTMDEVTRAVATGA
jgi:type II secretory ATPase GspE/PulE/Tfp pilus assembly ATPase PilB-like protein